MTDRQEFEAGALVDAILGDEAFIYPAEWASPANATIWKHIAAIKRDNGPLDVVRLAESLAASDELEGVGGLPYLGRLFERSIGPILT